MGFKQDEAVVIDGRVEVSTEKARKVVLETDGREVWIPKSCILFMGEPDIDGNREIHINSWIAGKIEVS